MDRPIAALLALLTIALVGGMAALSALGSGATAGPIYSIAAVNAGLRQHPRAWVGRTIRVQGVLQGTWCDVTAPCAQRRWSLDQRYSAAGGARFVLVDRPVPDPYTSRYSLLLALGSPTPVLAALRHMSFLRGFLPAQQHLAWVHRLVLRVRLQPRSCFITGQPWWCYEGVVLDGAIP